MQILNLIQLATCVQISMEGKTPAAPNSSSRTLSMKTPEVTRDELSEVTRVFRDLLSPQKNQSNDLELDSPMGVTKILKRKFEELAQSEIHNSSVDEPQFEKFVARINDQEYEKFLFKKSYELMSLEAVMTTRVLAALGVTDVSKEVVHFKGFALSGENKLVEHQQQIEEIATHLSKFKVVCYDGDDFKDKGRGSFVTVLPVLVYLMSNYPSVHVIAFKKSDEVDGFKTHLNNLWAHLYHQDPHRIYRSNVDDEDDLQGQAIASHVVLTKYWEEEALKDLATKQFILLEVAAQPTIEGLQGYQVFGVQIIHHYTRAKQVYVLGGGQTSYQEYQWLSKHYLESEKSQWHYFPAVRQNNETIYASAFEFIRAFCIPAPGNFHVHDK